MKTSQCALCPNECRKRDVVCSGCWKALAEKRKLAIQRATHRRDEVGKKFITQLLTCDLNVIDQMIADSNGRILEPTNASKFLKDQALSQALKKDEMKKEAQELV